MPKGPNGQKRPADSIGCAISVAKIATGEESDDGYVSAGRRKSGLAGAKARVESTTKKERVAIASKAASARWAKRREPMDRICDDTLHEFLFEHEGTELVNFKLLRGDSPDVTKEQICEQLKSALVQKAANQAHTVSDFPDGKGGGSINLAELEKIL